MPTYSSIAGSELAVNKPLTSSLMTRLSDNPIAIFEQLGWATTASLYTSPLQTITFAGLITLNHGLTSISNGYDIDVSVYLVCQTAEGGYSIGDVVPYARSGRDRSISIRVSTTQILLRTGSGFMWLTHATTGGDFQITAVNWKLVAKARG